MKLLIYGALWFTCFFIVLGLKTADESIGLDQAIHNFKEGTASFRQSSLELTNAVSLLDRKDSITVLRARQALAKSRMGYKRIEFFMDYFFESSAMVYNRPAKVEVDEPYMEYQEPSGFQVIEALLFDEDPVAHKTEVIEQADLISSSAADLNSLLYAFKGTDKEMLESIRLELVKVITLSITGYDAPELKTGIAESYQSLSAVQQILEPYLDAYPKEKDKLSSTLQATLAYLQLNADFDRFDRMEFLTRFALPLQEQLGGFINRTALGINHKSALNYNAKHMFSPDILSEESFLGENQTSKLKVALGKKLFLEKALSGNMKRNCASCHQPSQYFSDGLKTSLAFDDQSFVQRNAPTLLYAGFQYAQFWDGRVKTLPEQILAVIANPMEMNGVHQVVIDSLKNNSTYVKEFQEAFPGSVSAPVTIAHLSESLAAYVSSLAPRTSAFDRYMAGDQKAMNGEQVKGFNLFMGKGQCGSCHFAPLFNGLIPPFYKRTEYEILGTPANDDFEHLQQDTDKGRFGFFPIHFYDGAFKTPTVRNVEKTAPYMHNGVFKDLEKVVEFYNQGGGVGLHLDVPQQTLSAKPLHLSKEEVQQIVLFMHSLTDQL
ncbi:cytochrome c peroxidase [Pedobacter sp. AW31-3R]|uniref:cytochrome c peroxidase n=1 Tax=Pedobacter sp. AW31-3R TaxID=3445781 RepID=UPI003FA0F0B3